MAQTKTIGIPTTVCEQAKEVAEQKGMSIKEAIRLMCREGGYDV